MLPMGGHFAVVPACAKVGQIEGRDLVNVVELPRFAPAQELAFEEGLGFIAGDEFQAAGLFI